MFDYQHTAWLGKIFNIGKQRFGCLDKYSCILIGGYHRYYIRIGCLN